MRTDPTDAGATLAAVMHTAELELARVSAAPRLEAELLTAHATGADRRQLRALGARELDRATLARHDTLLARRIAGEPIAYILGEWEFWSLALEIGPDVLVPRPETEHLVACALAHIAPAEETRVLELGTGSGAIALAIARERPHARVTATDRSRAALAIAARNCARHGLTRIELLDSDWFAALEGRRFDLIVSNPPYVALDDPDVSPEVACWEPAEALFAGPSGLEAIELIATGSRRHLESGGTLLLEHGARQGDAVRDLLAGHGYTDIGTSRDLAGRDRVTCGRG
jgi:release factor glutamine methyltransferase